QTGLECQDTARALVLRASEDFHTQDIGFNFLCSNDEEEPGERAGWGIRRGRRSAQEIVRDVSRLLALTGPTVIAVDQIDLLIAQSAKSTAGSTQQQEEWRQALLLEQIAGGLMAMREMTRRTLSVVSCLPSVWELIKTKATDTVQDRFKVAAPLKMIPSAELGRELIEKRFTVRFGEIGYTPPYPTWPVLPCAFAEAVDFTPRELLITIDTHVRSCLRDGVVKEMAHLVASNGIAPSAVNLGQPPPPEAVADLDTRFAELRNAADPAPALDARSEDAVVPDLLVVGLTAWAVEQGPAGQAFSVDPPPGSKPALHGRLRRSLEESHKDREDEAHWAFRAIAASNAIAALNRIRNAATAAGLTEGVTKRRLFLLRDDEWSGGPRTKEVVAAFEAAGGQRLPFPADDVKILMALRDLLHAEGLDKLRPWLVARRPTRAISFLAEALADAADGLVDAGERQAPARTGTTHTGPSIRVGTSVDDGHPVTVELEALRKHTAIFAGSGSGKTVLIRRLVEECALSGVSAIVLDPNNDLARLGDPWPAPPSGWRDNDPARAEEYLANTDVVIWTPRRESGRPLSFQPLPDLSGVLDDADEFAAGVDAAVASLAPRAKVDANTNKAHLGQAVLRQALTYYARRRGSSLKELISVLAALPHGVSELDNAEKIAADMAQTLTAAMVNDPLFGGGGVPVDPGLLLTPATGKRARVSVISFIGLPSDEQRQSFVNQLQLALFAWIKRHPAGDRPLGGLLVMDEAQTLAPSGAMTACTQSTLALASQARKYGLGLMFATQAPKGLHNRIPGNAATQLFGLLNSPTQITAAREMARAKGSDIPEISRLRTGQFYAAVDGSSFEKIQAPLCLTHHPKSPLTTEEVVERAREGLA
ncbi:MAG TPA: ATP-binding protein, partial [Micromonosporaceae bacterium]|nr:ATP-binding protein [Micromonosporaceae bacterium]